jgi:NitT/TauT family transport system ATP-binding protein
MSEPLLRVENVEKVFTRKVRKEVRTLKVLDKLSLTVGPREFVTIIGPSGCGKSTLLNCVAGLTSYEGGSITLDGQRVTSPGDDRAFVFQQATLLPWRSIERNVAFGLEMRREQSKEQIAERVARAIQTVGLTGFEHHYPHEVSGGMQQRANLARALAVDAKLILMDEPFGALDALTKETLQDELATMSARYNRATLFITHDIREAVHLADTVIVMSPRPGKIIKELKIDFPRPRSRALTASAEFEQIVTELRGLLQHQTHDDPDAASAGGAG